jgi:hypothetical protein
VLVTAPAFLLGAVAAFVSVLISRMNRIIDRSQVSSLFTTGALAVIRYAKIHGTRHRPWLTALLARRPTKIAAIALANKLARMAWAMMARGERYKEPAALAA